MDKIINDEIYMQLALEKARVAFDLGEIPVGAVVVKNNEILSFGFNERETGKSATAHAELLAIERACSKIGSWRLHGCTLYVTLEPCPMCSGAIINSRIERVVCALKDPKAGALGSVLDMNSYPLNHKCKVEFGLMENESRRLLEGFFEQLRLKR
ncbi:MAG: nucleoside deaminase [Clostridia bacterium]|nr:nucleoside deaminase [Clostridia bacterium]